MNAHLKYRRVGDRNFGSLCAARRALLRFMSEFQVCKAALTPAPMSRLAFSGGAAVCSSAAQPCIPLMWGENENKTIKPVKGTIIERDRAMPLGALLLLVCDAGF